MTLAIIYLVLVGLGTFLGDINADLISLGLNESLINIVGKAIAASAGIIAAVRAIYDAAEARAMAAIGRSIVETPPAPPTPPIE